MCCRCSLLPHAYGGIFRAFNCSWGPIVVNHRVTFESSTVVHDAVSRRYSVLQVWPLCDRVICVLASLALPDCGQLFFLCLVDVISLYSMSLLAGRDSELVSVARPRFPGCYIDRAKS
jgi:hypothetical protein